LSKGEIGHDMWKRGRTLAAQIGLLCVGGFLVLAVFARDFGCGIGENQAPSGFCDAEKTTAGGHLFALASLAGLVLAIAGCIASQVTRRWAPAIAGLAVGGAAVTGIAVWAFSTTV
jgi:hypothetical protein